MWFLSPGCTLSDSLSHTHTNLPLPGRADKQLGTSSLHSPNSRAKAFHMEEGRPLWVWVGLPLRRGRGSHRGQRTPQAQATAEDTTEEMCHFSGGGFSHTLKSVFNTVLTPAVRSPLLYEKLMQWHKIITLHGRTQTMSPLKTYRWVTGSLKLRSCPDAKFYFSHCIRWSFSPAWVPQMGQGTRSQLTTTGYHFIL